MKAGEQFLRYLDSLSNDVDNAKTLEEKRTVLLDSIRRAVRYLKNMYKGA